MVPFTLGGWIQIARRVVGSRAAWGGGGGGWRRRAPSRRSPALAAASRRRFSTSSCCCLPVRRGFSNQVGFFTFFFLFLLFFRCPKCAQLKLPREGAAFWSVTAHKLSFHLLQLCSTAQSVVTVHMFLILRRSITV